MYTIETIANGFLVNSRDRDGQKAVFCKNVAQVVKHVKALLAKAAGNQIPF